MGRENMWDCGDIDSKTVLQRGGNHARLSSSPR
jgi:hypothetical protein